MNPAPSVERIYKFIRAVTLLQRCGRVDAEQSGSLAARSSELIAAKTDAAAACSALLQGLPSARDLLQRLESRLDVLQVLPRIERPLDDLGSNLVNASHIVRDFLFIGAASRGSNCIMSPKGVPQPKSAAFFEMNNIKFIINVACELCPPSSSFSHDIPFEDLSYPIAPDVVVTPKNLLLVSSSASLTDSVLVHIPMKDLDAWYPPPLFPHACTTKPQYPPPLPSFPPPSVACFVRTAELEAHLVVAGDNPLVAPPIPAFLLKLAVDS
jgi:hypothetical protein